MEKTMRIGIDFDNTIICYDEVFYHVARDMGFVSPDYVGSKRQLKQVVQASAEGDLGWQKIQGKVYGEYIAKAQIFPHFKEFLAQCQKQGNIEVCIVSHKTELGHFDEKRINLREAARQWLHSQAIIADTLPGIAMHNIYFETTREEKIARIAQLQCTHFIDDLPEVLYSPLFPDNIRKFHFQPLIDGETEASENKIYTNWKEITNAIFAA